MPRKITNNLKTTEAVAILERVEIDLDRLNKLIVLNYGKHPVLFRRTDSLLRKVDELIAHFEATND